jgi:hypothetical protein
MGIKFIFPVFFEELLHVAMWRKLPKLKGRVLRKDFVLPIESWFFISFELYFFLMVLHNVIFNMTATI